MSHRHYASRTFWKFFFSYFLLLSAVIIATTAAIWFNTRDRLVAEQAQEREADTRSMSAMINAELEQLARNAQQIRQIPWVHKLYSDSRAFDEYFSANRRKEIIREIPFYTGNASIVREIALIFPERNIAVSDKGWREGDEYLRMLRIPAEDQPLFWEELASTRELRESRTIASLLSLDTLVFLVPLENSAPSRAYLCYMVDRTHFETQLRQRMPGSMQGLVIEDATGEPLVRVRPAGGEWEEARETQSYPGAVMGLTYIFSYTDSVVPIPTGEFLGLLCRTLVIFFSGVALAYLLAFSTYRPLGRVLARVSRPRPKSQEGWPVSDYHMIEHSFAALERENVEMHHQVAQYSSMARTDLLRKLLKGYFDWEAVEREVAAYSLPFHNSGAYQVVLLSGGLTGERLEAVAAVELSRQLREYFGRLTECHVELVESIDHDFVAVLAFPEGSAASPVDVEFVRGLVQLAKPFFTQHPLVSAGRVQSGFVGISISYHFAMEQRSHLPRNLEFVLEDENGQGTPYYYPLEWENQLLLSLKNGNTAAVQSILQELRRENHDLEGQDLEGENGIKLLAALVETLLRAISELSLSDLDFMDEINRLLTGARFEEKWDCLLALSGQICSLSERLPPPPDDGVGAELLRYVDKNFRDSGLCLKELATQFHLSVQSVSKLFKAASGDTFYNYLYRKRMEYACELLRDAGETMASVARQVGYENDFSFKRAFVRYSGMRPRDYMRREQSTDSGGAEECPPAE